MITGIKKSDDEDINFEDIPVLNPDSIEVEDINESYDILIESGSISINSFINKLEVRTGNNTKKCWGIYMFLKNCDWINSKSEGWIESNDNFSKAILEMG